MGRVKSSVSAQPERGGYGGYGQSKELSIGSARAGGYGQSKELSIGSARAGATGRVKSSVSAQPEQGATGRVKSSVSAVLFIDHHQKRCAALML